MKVSTGVRIVFMGPPGAGKGTQAALLARSTGVPAISTGDLFRSHVSRRTPLGLQAQELMDAGEYVPDTVTNEMVRERLGLPDAHDGFLLDGYPRTVAQVTELDAIVDSLGHQVDAVVCLDAGVEHLLQRLLLRAEASGRTDDTEDVIRHRLTVYTQQTEPLLAIYHQRGILHRVDGLGSVCDVAGQVMAALRGAVN